jgi:hypothetical protein
MRARFIHQIGIAGQLRIYWNRVRGKEVFSDGYISTESLNDCPCSYGRQGSAGIHNAYASLGNREGTEDWHCFGKNEDYPSERWPTKCEHCGQPVPTAFKPTKIGEDGISVTHQVFTWRLYNTNSGKPEPGDVFWIKLHEPNECWNWDNCNGVHLHGIGPNGDEWDVDGRASNCSMRGDRAHRCWVRTGSPEDGTIHVDKNGHTCAAGAGSVILGNWHGFLHHGQWTT